MLAKSGSSFPPNIFSRSSTARRPGARLRTINDVEVVDKIRRGE